MNDLGIIFPNHKINYSEQFKLCPIFEFNFVHRCKMTSVLLENTGF